ncbi:MAG: hypothetical protein E6K79_07935 [Candidatus Eisenbacteria bacterium]|uniref:Uncharacterized protein n=1 Tax=Eiseniibacteriota bacterium TaxID=2212470 RepID=A0A538TKQ5_UNCEI|nr:MAG: hypothetical protein E6K79_07935 [Candidatus Eisenbacteria bacterium]
MPVRDRALVLLPLVLFGLSIAAGCAREPQDVHEARLAAERFVAAMAGKDLAELRERATCIVSLQSVQGGNVLRLGPARRVPISLLDSLTSSASATHQRAESLWARPGGGDKDAQFDEVRRAARVEVIYRNALRAIALSRPGVLNDSETLLETRAIRMRIRYAGPVIGPKPVDREMILRLLKAPAGKWIAFSLYAAEDDPQPDGV